MDTPTRDQRIAFWKHAYSRAAFVEAKNFSRYLLDCQVELNDIRRSAFTIAIATAYCRPFKQSPLSIRLSDALVPTNHRDTHDALIIHRDKVIAHRDLDGPNADWGFVSDVYFVIKNNELGIHTRSPSISDENAANVVKLADHLISVMNREINGFVSQFGSCLSSADGAFAMSLEKSEDAWLRPLSV